MVNTCFPFGLTASLREELIFYFSNCVHLMCSSGQKCIDKAHGPGDVNGADPPE